MTTSFTIKSNDVRVSEAFLYLAQSCPIAPIVFFFCLVIFYLRKLKGSCFAYIHPPRLVKSLACRSSRPKLLAHAKLRLDVKDTLLVHTLSAHLRLHPRFQSSINMRSLTVFCCRWLDSSNAVNPVNWKAKPTKLHYLFSKKTFSFWKSISWCTQRSPSSTTCRHQHK